MAGRLLALLAMGSRLLKTKWDAPPSTSCHLLLSLAMIAISATACFTFVSVANARQTWCFFWSNGYIAIFWQDENRRVLYPGAGVYGPELARFGCPLLPEPYFKSSMRYVAIPAWMIAVPSPLVWYLRARRRDDGTCRKCRYDFRGLPEGACCPECGPQTRHSSRRVTIGPRGRLILTPSAAPH